MLLLHRKQLKSLHMTGGGRRKWGDSGGTATDPVNGGARAAAATGESPSRDVQAGRP